MPLLVTMLDGEEVDAATLVMAETAYNWSRAIAYAIHTNLNRGIGVPKDWNLLTDSEKLAWVRLTRRLLQ